MCFQFSPVCLPLCFVLCLYANPGVGASPGSPVSWLLALLTNYTCLQSTHHSAQLAHLPVINSSTCSIFTPTTHHQIVVYPGGSYTSGLLCPHDFLGFFVFLLCANLLCLYASGSSLPAHLSASQPRTACHTSHSSPLTPVPPLCLTIYHCYLIFSCPCHQTSSKNIFYNKTSLS